MKKSSKEEAKAEFKQAEIEAQKKRLKNLIVLGKERGYLTYAEINDHLPDDMTDAEQIEGVVTMLADMGIAVYDEAPDAEQLLMTEAPAPDVDGGGLRATAGAATGTGSQIDRDPTARIRFEVSARAAYLDLKPVLERYRRTA